MSGGWHPEPSGVVPQPPITAKRTVWPGKAEFIKEYLLTVLSTGQYCESEIIIQWANKSWELIHGE